MFNPTFVRATASMDESWRSIVAAVRGLLERFALAPVDVQGAGGTENPAGLPALGVRQRASAKAQREEHLTL